MPPLTAKWCSVVSTESPRSPTLAVSLEREFHACQTVHHLTLPRQIFSRPESESTFYPIRKLFNALLILDRSASSAAQLVSRFALPLSVSVSNEPSPDPQKDGQGYWLLNYQNKNVFSEKSDRIRTGDHLMPARPI
jgi:hypothetical protein